MRRNFLVTYYVTYPVYQVKSFETTAKSRSEALRKVYKIRGVGAVHMDAEELITCYKCRRTHKVRYPTIKCYNCGSIIEPD